MQNSETILNNEIHVIFSTVEYDTELLATAELEAFWFFWKICSVSEFLFFQF